jgi:hypothetical protein
VTVAFAQRWAGPLLLLHAIAAAVLVAASTHQVLYSARYLRHAFDGARRERRLALAVGVAFAACFALGLLLYPTYRVHVRAALFDRPESHLLWVARLFDIKEMGMLLGLGVSTALATMARRLHPVDLPLAAPLYVALSAILCLSSWGALVAGLLTVSYRSVAAT